MRVSWSAQSRARKFPSRSAMIDISPIGSAASPSSNGSVSLMGAAWMSESQLYLAIPRQDALERDGGPFESHARDACRLFQSFHRHEVRSGAIAHPCDAMLR